MSIRIARCEAWAYGVTVILVMQSAVADSGAADLVSKSLAVTSDTAARMSLDASGKTIGNIRIDNRDIFDTEKEAESGVFYRLANALHIQTRSDVIRQQLLLQEGDLYVAQSVEESERMLRQRRFLSSAEIHPVRLDGDTVDLEVVTEDTWSLTPSLRFARKGGENTGGFEISDSNVLGSGSEVRVGYRSGIERDEAFFGYRDPQLGSSRMALSLGYADASDGQQHEIVLQQPFYSMDARRAGGISLQGFEQIDSLYSMGQVDRRYDHTAGHAELFYGWSKGLNNGHASRWTTGVGFDQHQISSLADPAQDTFSNRRDVYPFVGYEWIEDRFETTRNADNLYVVEDRHVGMRFAGRIGYASDQWGSDGNAWLASLGVRRGFRVFGDDLILASFDATGRFSSASPAQSLLDGSLRYYHRQSPKRLLFAAASVTSGSNLDPDQQLTLGGETGLRGYPIHHLNGDVMALLTLEQRFYTDWYPFHLFRVGGAMFFDAGKALRSSAGMPGFDGWHRDVGIGLRIGSPRSSSGRMLHLDYACPLDAQPGQDQCQVIVETRHNF